MDYRFNEDQLELRTQARRFLAAESTHAATDAAMKTERGYDPALWSRITEELGWPALIVPEAHDGIGLTFADLHPLVEEMGRHMLAAPFFSTVGLGMSAILVAGSEAQQAELLPQLAMGEKTATLGYRGATAAGGSEGAAAVGLELVREGDDVVLSGEVVHVVDGHTADVLIVAARHPGSEGSEGISLVVLPADAEGLNRTWTRSMDQARKLARLSLADVRLPATALLGEEGAAGPALEAALDLARVVLAAEQVGAAEACLDMAVEYAKVRKQFGRPIGSFQSIKHKCADMLLRVECARSAAFFASQVATQALAGDAFDEGRRAELAEAASSAAAYCADALYFCAGENIQIHGGIGFTWEHAAHLYFKRAQSSANLLGSSRYHRERVATLMGL